MFRRRKGQTYNELVVDELEDRKKRKKRVKNCCCFGIFCVLVLLCIGIICTVVIVLVSLKIACTGKKKFVYVHESYSVNNLKEIKVYATGDIRIVSMEPGNMMSVNFTQFAMTSGKQKKKTNEVQLGNDSISIHASEPYGGTNGMGWYMGHLCSGTDVTIQIPDPSFTNRPNLKISAQSEHGSVFYEFSYFVEELTADASNEIVIDTAKIMDKLQATTVREDILVENLNISDHGHIMMKNRFGKVSLIDMRTTFSNVSWPTIDIETKYGDVNISNSDRADMDISSTFNGDILVTYQDYNLGVETIGFNLSTDKMSLNDVSVKANHRASSHHTVAYESHYEYDKVREIIGTISYVSDLPIYHHLNLHGLYAGIRLEVDD